MTDIETLFKHLKAMPARLLSFGFAEHEAAYTYSAGLVDGQFTMRVTVGKEGKISAQVIENSSGESYVLHLIPGAGGAFVGQVRQEYERLLTQLAAACFEPDVFKSEDARRVIAYAREKYQHELEFLWPRFPQNAILRRQDNAKWYAALLTVPAQKLGLPGDAPIEILDLRGAPQDIAALVDNKKYFPGFHMNKKHWFTLCLDGSVAIEEIFRRLDESFALAKK